jgi:glycosyltransferase involved in cell wall biosynthesis
MKKITFVIPTINRDTLARAIESLKNQTVNDWNAIVVFDGVEEICFNDSRIQSLRIEKSGVAGQSGVVRNYGIKGCKTEWIGFLDDDDTITPDYVETLLNKYEDKDLVIWKMIYADGLVLPPKDHHTINVNCVGISFCFKNKFENVLFDRNYHLEDFEFLEKMQSLTDNWIIAEEICYKVRH